MSALTDLSGLVESCDLEGDGAAFYGSDLGFGSHLKTNRSGRQVGDVQLRAHGSLLFAQSVLNGIAGGTFHQRNHTGGSVDQQTSGTDFLGSILTLDEADGFALHSNGNFHNHTSFFCIKYIPYHVMCQ